MWEGCFWPPAPPLAVLTLAHAGLFVQIREVDCQLAANKSEWDFPNCLEGGGGRPAIEIALLGS